ncbi:NAD(P)-binding protein [Cryphonectria parasitica EP155]|uniref:NAD(P)-binding protein n=1 Tax=Cryphonectria parasitica (strain ATCC 38755 / EP155) TaxID=660469 RepID=A0A9P4Y4V7_CRYP1|nr:NAD(P)-binding protein [Cryphonectria parasitica EP155]KAF3766583.1 NAD(P)-binding protein [Cryphonectria parasitica EP155]
MPVPDNEIKGRLALVTGASGGIGGACARDLFVNGAHLALTYSRNKASVDTLVSELQQLPQWSSAKVSTHQADMASAEDIQRIFTEIKDQHGQDGPDILVSNAGYGKRIPNILDIPIDEFDYTLTVNLRASFILCKLSIPHMQTRGWGRIVFIGSLAAYGGGINGCHYAASKAGLQGMMRNLARKHAGQGITVNDIAPAMVGDTGLVPDENSVKGTAGDVNNIPVGRLGSPQEVANMVTMCVRTGYLTGQSMLLSGGLM